MNSKLFFAVAVAATLLAPPAFAQAEQRVLIYGDSNVWGWVPTEQGFPTGRRAYDARLAGLIDQALPDNVHIIEDGLNNRTSNVDDPNTWSGVDAGAFNGARALPAILAAQAPLDVVVVMLGTNDLKTQFERTADDAAQGIAEIIGIIKASAGTVANIYDAPQILVVAPPPTGPLDQPDIAPFFAGAGEKSDDFAAAYAAVSAENGVAFVDAGASVGRIDGLDGIHFTAEEQQQLAAALATRIEDILKTIPARE